MYPLPPWICTPRSATLPAISEQNNFVADGAILRSSPVSHSLAASRDQRSARHYAVCWSAIIACTNWNSPIGVPP